jgi:hypothetical protein
MALVVVATLALAAAVLLAGGADPTQPVAVVGHTGAPEPLPTTTAAPAPAPASTTTTKPKPKTAAATRSTTVVRSDAGGVTVVNEGSSTASSGNNTVIGPPSAQGPSGPQSGVTVNEGPVTAVGNSADVRIRP